MMTFHDARKAVSDGEVSRLRELAAHYATLPDDKHAHAICLAPFPDRESRKAALLLLSRLSDQASETVKELEEYADAALSFDLEKPTRWNLSSAGRSLAVLFNNVRLLELADQAVVEEELERIVFVVDRAYFASIDHDGVYEIGNPQTGKSAQLASHLPPRITKQPNPIEMSPVLMQEVQASGTAGSDQTADVPEPPIEHPSSVDADAEAEEEDAHLEHFSL
jgi:hypothetical protein